MLRKRQQRGLMWAAGISMAAAAVASWWTALENGGAGADLVAPIGFTVAAMIWFVNVLVAKAAAETTGGDTR